MKFKRSHTKIQALLDFGSEINAMTLAYAAELELYVCFINVEAQKIDESTFLTHNMMLAKF